MTFDTAEQTLARLPEVKGRYSTNEPLAPSSWFRVGGPAEVMFKPTDHDDLAKFLKECPEDIPVTVLGVASNTIIRDGGIAGVVIRMGREFNTIAKPTREDILWPFDDILIGHEPLLEVGAACLDINVANIAQREGITGLEFLSGIPGTIGGALRMNAGCYGREISDVLVEATAYDRKGKRHVVTASEMDMQYRHTSAPSDWIFVSCVLRGKFGDPAEIKAHMEDIKAKREASQPIREKTGGSTFANPERDTPGAGSAWQAVDKAGLRGFTIGGAQMSEKHCNFMINTGTASAADLETLGDTVRETVREKLGIELRWEIKRIGIAK